MRLFNKWPYLFNNVLWLVCSVYKPKNYDKIYTLICKKKKKKWLNKSNYKFLEFSSAIYWFKGQTIKIIFDGFKIGLNYWVDNNENIYMYKLQHLRDAVRHSLHMWQICHLWQVCHRVELWWVDHVKTMGSMAELYMYMYIISVTKFVWSSPRGRYERDITSPNLLTYFIPVKFQLLVYPLWNLFHVKTRDICR